MKNVIAEPVVWLCAYADAIAVFLAILATTSAWTDLLTEAGMGHTPALLASLIPAIFAGYLADLLWFRPFGEDGRSLQDVSCELADRVADWAGWPCSCGCDDPEEGEPR